MVYAPLALVVSGFVEVFFVTGYIIYGFALSSAVVVLHAAGQITYLEIIIYSYIGTLLGSYANFATGWFLADWPIARKFTDSPKALQIRAALIKHNLFMAMTVCRFVTILRPACMIMLGTLKLPPKRVLIYEAIIAFVWVVLWSTILVLGSDTIIKTVKMIII